MDHKPFPETKRSPLKIARVPSSSNVKFHNLWVLGEITFWFWLLRCGDTHDAPKSPEQRFDQSGVNRKQAQWNCHNKSQVRGLSWEKIMLLDQATLFTCGVLRTPSFGSNRTGCKPYVGYGAAKKIENKQVHAAHKATCVLLHYYLS